MSTLVQGRIGIALRFGSAVDGMQASQLSVSSRQLLPQFDNLIKQPSLYGHQLGAHLRASDSKPDGHAGARVKLSHCAHPEAFSLEPPVWLDQTKS